MSKPYEITNFIKEDNSIYIDIELRVLKTVLDDVIIGDYVEFHTKEIQEVLFGGYVVTVDKFISD